MKRQVENNLEELIEVEGRIEELRSLNQRLEPFYLLLWIACRRTQFSIARLFSLWCIFLPMCGCALFSQGKV
ncbi:MAG TPA: hypothetical protein VIL52_06585 [Bacteroidota bacterium]